MRNAHECALEGGEHNERHCEYPHPLPCPLPLLLLSAPPFFHWSPRQLLLLYLLATYPALMQAFLPVTQGKAL